MMLLFLHYECDSYSYIITDNVSVVHAKIQCVNVDVFRIVLSCSGWGGYGVVVRSLCSFRCMPWATVCSLAPPLHADTDRAVDEQMDRTSIEQIISPSSSRHKIWKTIVISHREISWAKNMSVLPLSGSDEISLYTATDKHVNIVMFSFILDALCLFVNDRVCHHLMNLSSNK